MKGFKYLRRACMTLLETLIAMMLLSALLFIVFGFFRELTELTRMTENAQRESFQMRYVESRLAFIFERIVNENESTTRSFFFYTDPPRDAISPFTSLIFTFDNGIRLDPTFSGDILGRLYVDRHQRLSLAMWPLNVDDPHEEMKEEVLLDHVVGIQFQFYSAPERVTNDQTIKVPPPIAPPTHGKLLGKDKPEPKQPEKDHWYTDEWLLAYEQMPSIIRITLTVAEKSTPFKLPKDNSTEAIFEYAFVLPSSKNPVYYPQG